MTNLESIETGVGMLTRDNAQQDFLGAFLKSTARPPHTMNFYQLDGYLRAICSGPGVAIPSQWLPLVFNDGVPEYSDSVEAQQVMNNLLSLYNFHANEIATSCCTLPLPVIYSTRKDERVNLEQWARGFLQGYIFWETEWNKTLDQVSLDEVDAKAMILVNEDFDAALNIISAIADVELAVAQGTEVKDLPEIFTRLPGAIIDFGRIGKLLYEYNVVAQPPVRT